MRAQDFEPAARWQCLQRITFLHRAMNVIFNMLVSIKVSMSICKSFGLTVIILAQRRQSQPQSLPIL